MNITAKQGTGTASFKADTDAGFVVFNGDNRGLILSELGNTPENVFRAFGREMPKELVVNGLVRCQHEEVAALPGEVQIGDERAHQPGLSHARCQGKTQRRKLPLKIGPTWMKGVDQIQRGS